MNLDEHGGLIYQGDGTFVTHMCLTMQGCLVRAGLA